MTKADELWEKYSKPQMLDNHFHDVMLEKDFISALAEYGQAVRKKDADVARNLAVGDLAKTVCDRVADAISMEPLP